MASRATVETGSTGLARTVGSVHLLLAGGTNVAAGVAVLWLAASGRLLAVAIGELGRYGTPATALRYGGLVAAAATEGAIVVGVALVGVGVLGCAVAYGFAQGDGSRRRGVALACCNGMNPLAFPLAFVAAALFTLPHTGLAVRGPTGDSSPVDAGTIAGGERDRDAGGVTGDQGAAGATGDERARDDADYGGEPAGRS